tara:strand:+ start:860 stop:2161 length:1302 start_codon:yes stop_codon:yes gene_type:complete
MSFKRFRDQDLIYTTLKTHPQYNFIVNSGKVFLQKERTKKGNISNEAIKHVPTGSVSLYELNIDRGEQGRSVITSSLGFQSPDLISLQVPLRNRDYSLRPFNMSRSQRQQISDESAVALGAFVDYPMSASISRIYVKQDLRNVPIYAPQPDNTGKHPILGQVNENRKYITALENLISFPDDIQKGEFTNYKLGETNMICIPAIFYGSSIKKGSIKLDYYVTGSVIASAEDKDSDGKIFCTSGPDSVKDTQIGTVLYNQGLLLLTSSDSLHETTTDNYFDSSESASPSWLNFGTGIKEVGSSGLTPGLCANSSYAVNFKGTNKVPTLTMFAFSERGEHNFSNNPTFLENSLQGTESLLDNYSITTSSFSEGEVKVNKINKSKYSDAEEEFLSTTYISKVGIYDKEKNLIAVATLANPAKKTEKRDFMIKMKIDF